MTNTNKTMKTIILRSIGWGLFIWSILFGLISLSSCKADTVEPQISWDIIPLGDGQWQFLDIEEYGKADLDNAQLILNALNSYDENHPECPVELFQITYQPGGYAQSNQIWGIFIKAEC